MQRLAHSWKTRVVHVGNLPIGGDNPVRLQSMTTSDTCEVFATIEQILHLIDSGAELVRMTVQGMREVAAVYDIKNKLVQKGISIPLVADIHFYPKAAMEVVEVVDKVRINPGNFIDKRATFKVLEYTDSDYSAELNKIEEKFAPLVEKCIQHKRALRIGTNHGSLSDRIMNRYGDTPCGMVESAFEFARVCRKMDFHNFLFSMKASNPVVMIEAYRLLVARMLELGWDYPLHIGVTEAGEGEDGRIKSAVGIGTLLLEGIGDTIRVSLTEDPWEEIPPARQLAKLKQAAGERKKSFSRSLERGIFLLSVDAEEVMRESFFSEIGAEVQFGRPVRTPQLVDYLLYTSKAKEPLKKLEKLGIPILSREKDLEGALYLAQMGEKNLPTRYALEVNGDTSIEDYSPEVILWHNPSQNPTATCPILLACDSNDLLIETSARLGSLLTDGFGEGIAIEASEPLMHRHRYCLALLQACRMRSAKTEFISCPGCGRTLFNLQEVSKRIKEKTGHLPGVKIAIMGCIVNGPGEMADADFGYVGSRPGKIDLYVGKTCVQKNIDMDDADDQLISLIKSHGKWK